MPHCLYITILFIRHSIHKTKNLVLNLTSYKGKHHQSDLSKALGDGRFRKQKNICFLHWNFLSLAQKARWGDFSLHFALCSMTRVWGCTDKHPKDIYGEKKPIPNFWIAGVVKVYIHQASNRTHSKFFLYHLDSLQVGSLNVIWVFLFPVQQKDHHRREKEVNLKPRVEHH